MSTGGEVVLEVVHGYGGYLSWGLVHGFEASMSGVIASEYLKYKSPSLRLALIGTGMIYWGATKNRRCFSLRDILQS